MDNIQNDSSITRTALGLDNSFLVQETNKSKADAKPVEKAPLFHGSKTVECMVCGKLFPRGEYRYIYPLFRQKEACRSYEFV